MKIQEIRRIADSLPFRVLIEHLREVFWVAAEDLRQIFYVSPSYMELWGRPCERLYEDPEEWLAAVVPEDQSRVRAVRAEGKERGHYAVEYRIVRPDRTERWVAERGHWVWDESSGGIMLLVGLAEDVTERKARDAVKEDFIAQAAHGLRSPLMGVRTALENLRGDDMSGWTPLQTRSVAALSRSVDRLTHLVHNLLDLARLESGTVAIHRQPLAIRPCIAEALEVAREEAKGQSIVMRIECPPDVPPVAADREMLQQLLVNLVANAVRFAKGEVTVRVVGTTPETHITVSDDGPGIAPEAMPTLFRKFGQLGREREVGPYKGSGLGLAICKQIVALHNGRIWAESEAGKGAQFHVVFP